MRDFETDDNSKEEEFVKYREFSIMQPQSSRIPGGFYIL